MSHCTHLITMHAAEHPFSLKGLKTIGWEYLMLYAISCLLPLPNELYEFYEFSVCTFLWTHATHELTFWTEQHHIAVYVSQKSLNRAQCEQLETSRKTAPARAMSLNKQLLGRWPLQVMIFGERN